MPNAQALADRTVTVDAHGVTLEGTLGIPAEARGIVLFAHGSGSSRFSSRNRYVASELRDAGLATLLLDLLSSAEEQVDLVTRHLRFDIPLLAARLVDTIDWVGKNLLRGYLCVIGIGHGQQPDFEALSIAVLLRHQQFTVGGPIVYRVSSRA